MLLEFKENDIENLVKAIKVPKVYFKNLKDLLKSSESLWYTF